MSSARSDSSIADTTGQGVRRASERRRANGAQTRSKLLESARGRADARTGPEFTVDDIAAGAGVSRAAFYVYFENKLAICEEVARTTQTAFVRSAVAFERGADLRETIEHGVGVYIRSFRDDRPGMRMVYELAYAVPEVRTLVHDVRSQVYRAWEREFDLAVATSQCEPFDVPLVSRLLVGMLETFCVRTMRTDEYRGALDSDPVATISTLWCRSVGVE
ncbi:MAG: TetR/AcrR family transcriptional regulator [Microbacterium sp.]